MKKKPKTIDLATLRKQAEKKLAKQTERLHKLSTQDIEHLIHELGTHQIELEMQNEELRRAQEELEASRSRYSDLYDFAPVGYFTFNGKGLILEANLTAARELDLERGRIINKPFRMFVVPEDRNIFDRHIREVFESESRQTCEVRLKRKSGIEFHARLESISVQDLNGNDVFRTSLIDITENKKAETLLKEERDFISVVLSTEGALVVVLDLQGRIVSFNKTCELVTGYSFDEVKGLPLWDFLLIPEDVKAVRAVFNELKTGQYPNKHENYWVTKDRRHRSISWSNTALLDSNGNVKYVIGTGIDITERNRAEDEIKRFASFPQLNPNPVLEVDSSGIIVFFNAGTVLTLRELNIGNADVFLPGDLDTILNRLRQGEEASLYREVKIKDKIFGETLHLAQQFNSVRIYANDITERKSYQEAVQNALLESRQRSGEIAALLEGSQAILKYHDFESAARSIFDSCKQVIGATSGYIALLSKDGAENEVLFLDSGGLPCSVDPGLPMPIRGLRGEAYNNLKAVYDNDFHQSEWMKFMPEGHVRLENVLFAPMVVEGKAVGLLGIANKLGGFTKNDARIASAFAELSAIALINKRAEEALRQSEEYFRVVTENASDVITILDANGTIHYESQSVEQVLGYKQKELIGKSAFDLIHPDDLANVRDVFSQIIQKPGITLSAEFRCRHNDGSWRVLGAMGKNLLDDPALGGIVVNSRDITERKQAEKAIRYERKKLVNILDSMEDGVYIVNQQYDIEYVNPLVEREYGRVKGRKCHEYFEGRKKTCTWCKNQEVFKGRTVRSEWYSEKTNKTYDLINTPLKNPDGSVSKLGIFRDITERKNAEHLLRESEEKFRTIFDGSNDGILIADVGSKEFFMGNNSICNMLGYRQDEIKNLAVTDIHPQEDLPVIEKRFEEMARGKAVSIENVPVKRKDGSIFYVDINSALITLTGKKYIVGSFRDITERKQAEEALMKANRTLRALSNSNQAMLHAEREEELLRDVCEIVVEDCGHAMVWIGFAEDNENKTVRPVASAGLEKGYLETLNVTWADTERGRGPTGTAIRTGRPSICRNMVTDPAFEPWREEAINRGYASSIVLPLMADGKAFGAINIYAREPDPFTEDEVQLLSELTGDLSYGILAMRSKVAHAEAEDAVRKSEKRYRSLFNNMTEGFAIHEIITDDSGTPIDYRFLEINPAFERLTGLIRDNVLGKTVKEVIPEIEPHWIETYGRVALSGEPSHFESYATALEKHYEVFAYCNAPRQFAVIFMDVTERKKAEQALRESEARLNRSQEIAHLGSWELDVVNNRLTWSDEVYRIFGLQPQEFAATYEAFLEAVHPEDRAVVNAAYSGSIREKRNTYEIEHRVVRRSSGEIRVVQEKCDHFRDRSGRIIRSVGMVLDITERKRMEDDLRRSRDELELRVLERTKELQKAYTEIEAFFESSLTPFVFFDKDFNFIRVNEAYAKCCARDISEFEGHNHFEFYPHEENEAIFRRVVETKTPYQAFAKAFSFPDHPEWGTTHWDWTLTPILDFAGEVDFLVFALNDVTERKQSENELKEHERLLTTMLENLPVGVWTLDREGNISQGNPAALEIWGGAKYVGVNGFTQYKGWWLDTGKLIEPGEWGAARAIQKGETSLNEEVEIECFDGTRKIILHSAIPLFDVERNITGAVVVNQDITNQKKAEETIRAERQRLYSVLEKLPAYVCLLTPDYTFAYVNQEFKRLFGDPSDRLCYEYLFNCQEPCEGCQTYKIFTEHKDKQQWEWVGPNGNTYAIYDHAFSDIDGTPLILEMGLDITDRKRALEALVKSEARLGEAERIALLGNWEWDIGNDVVSLSDELYRIFDIEPEKFHPTYESFLHLVHPDDLKNVSASIRKAVREKKPFDMDFRFMRNDGVVRVMHGRGEITYDLSGRPLLVRGTGQDITDRVKAEKALRDSEERYRMLIETMNEGLGMDDENGLLVYANDRLCEMLGYSLDEIIGRPILSFFDEKNQKVLRQQVEKRRSGENDSYRLEWIKKDGQKIITLVSPRGIFNSAGKYKGSFAVITDVTEKLRLESIAEAVNTMNNIGFIFSGVRHEIGNPVNSIKMALSVLKQNLDSYSKEMIREYADRMLSEIQRLEYLLKAMKSFNLFETMDLIDVNMTTFIDNFLRLISEDFAKKGIRIETDILETLWAYIDPRAFQQVLLNVMTNASDALEGRENATITIRVSKLGNMINIMVEDNGSGMSENQVEDLFKPFYTTKDKGTGLGLVISKKMMTKMKGLIEVVSEKDKGTIVDLFVPEGISEEE
jgi:PAS domain S-box-containing protein